MARARATTAAILLAVAVVVAASSAQVAHCICNLSSDGIEACKPAAAIHNPTDAPSAECCAALAAADLPCLCRYKRSNGGLVRWWATHHYKIDLNRAVGLPAKCGLTLPADC